MWWWVQIEMKMQTIELQIKKEILKIIWHFKGTNWNILNFTYKIDDENEEEVVEKGK